MSLRESFFILLTLPSLPLLDFKRKQLTIQGTIILRSLDLW
jgi:hypothetical protein